MKRLAFAEPAARDLEAIVDYIALDNPVAAEKTYRGIIKTVRNLPEFPALGRPGRYPETRELSIPDLPYLVIYEVGEEAVTVLAVFHTSRDLVRALSDRIQRPQSRIDDHRDAGPSCRSLRRRSPAASSVP